MADNEISISKDKMKKLHKQAIEAFAMKLGLENLLRRKVGGLFNTILKDFKLHYAKHGAPINAYDYQKDLEEILRQHHIKVGNEFSNSIRNELGNPKNNNNVQKKLDANIKGSAAQHAHLASHDISDTTRENIEKSVKQAHVELALNDEDYDDEDVADLAEDYLDKKLSARQEMIAITETGIAASVAHQLEYDTLDDMDAEFEDGDTLEDKKPKKMWVAILDDHTREWHAEADGQIVDVDEPFEVGGEELPEPLDDSLGASADNICGCRCMAVYLFE